ncbi:hypothetical protein DSM03_11721 [Leeuwenhoekiella aestuarii]|uniref:hypothetical protein n=1 Tax=Leeuwenhoekiella aestuarii TaxID=2249426 RepID=UPI000FFE4A15|nr:hypothetical protein [Leeuwenhoekiella aestuarii]RXG11384.1 hypothetical protein DSM03_11721 [Leeuwenhoekiella aestuarii]
MHLWGLHKVKAGALQFTLFIGVLVILILGSFVLLSYTHQRFKDQSDLLQETIQLADQGVIYALNSKRPLNSEFSAIEYPNLKSFQEIAIVSQSWGIYELVKSRAVSKNYQFERYALIGGKKAIENRQALFLANTYAPLVVVGSSQITGNAQLSEYGLKPGNMGSAYFKGSRLIDGTISTHTREELPEFPEFFQNNVASLFKIYPRNDEVINYNRKSIYNSFKAETKWVFESQNLLLQDSILGNVIIKSEKQITVGSEAYLSNVILIAPEIAIESGVNGNFQAFATEKIIVGSKVKLKYPSALVLQVGKRSLQNPGSIANQQEVNTINIGSNSMIKGSLVFLGNEPNINYEPELFIDTGSELFGDIYCEQNFELKGSVFGSVYTKAFIARDFGSVYRNHLYNGIINVGNLTQEFVGLPVQNTQKGIAKWVY